METGEVLAKTAIFVGLGAAIKIVLASIPNVEMVTLWIAVVVLVYGLKVGVMVAFLGNMVADLYIGFGPWTIFVSMGFVMVACFVWAAKPLLTGSLSYGLIAVAATILFDVFTVVTSMSLLFGYSVKMALFQQYGLFVPPAYYPFGWIHLGSNAIIFYVLANPLIKTLKKVNHQ
ncbi:MAG: ECF transporter S component [Theionarchaea archaeon]|nr:ECF transporter S component [Theionarchaea archaeon]MBU7020340.1 ECF transporter S component [Theionarchaea archaeon]MBU7034813.1 ECF transporter S component [Theionarchaea archaeon]MBU7040274.1 ECF transporter S component [Theionarchaea archaeon]